MEWLGEVPMHWDSGAVLKRFAHRSAKRLNGDEPQGVNFAVVRR